MPEPNGKSLKVPWGLSAERGRLLHVDDVPNGKRSGCVCPACEIVLVAKNKGHRKVHHFAHCTPSVSCEGWLHATAKHALFERIESALSEKRAVDLSWECPDQEDCSCLNHTGNLVKQVDGVRLEKQIRHSVTWIQPDITLTKGGSPSILIEIVDTSKPKERTFEYVKNSCTRLLVFDVADVNDISTLIEGVLEPSQITDPPSCPCPPCHRYSGKKRCPGVLHIDCDICEKCFVDATDHGIPLHKHCSRCKDVCLGRYRTSKEKYGIPIVATSKRSTGFPAVDGEVRPTDIAATAAMLQTGVRERATGLKCAIPVTVRSQHENTPSPW